jgi:predicted transcriptional regulator
MELAEKLDLPQGYISRIEHGKIDIRTSKLIDIARILGLEVMLIPRKFVASVEALIKDNDYDSDRPLYDADLDVDD